MALGRPILPLQLSREERETLERWVRRPKSAQALALRARVILACAQGKTNTAVAQQMHLAKPTVGKWRSRFVARRLDGLLDEPRPGAPREISDAAVERVLTWTLEKRPADATHWSTSELEKAIHTYIETTNARPKPFVWTKTADEILASVARFCKRTYDSGH